MLTRPDAPAGRGRTLRAVAGRRARAERGHPGAEAAGPRDPDVPGAAAPSSRRTAARSSPTAPSCRRRRSTSRRTAGSTCTSRCCPPGAGRPRCSTRSGTATTSPGAGHSCSRRASTPGRCYGTVTETDPAATTPSGRPARPAGRTPGPGCSSPPSTASRPAPLARSPQAGDGVTWPRRSPSTSAGRAGTCPRHRRRPAGPRVHARPGGVDDLPRGAARARVGAAAHGRGWPRALAARRRCASASATRCARHRRPVPLRLDRVAAGPASARWPAADWARGGPARSRPRTPRMTAVGPAGPRPASPPTSVLRAVRERRRLRQPRAAALLRRAPAGRPRRGVRHRARLRHAARPGLLRRGARGLRRPARGRRGRPAACSTSCAWARTSCCACGCPTTPRSPPPCDLARPSSGRRAEPGSSTPCCAGSPPATLDGVGRRGCAPTAPTTRRAAGRRALPPALDRPRRSATRCARPAPDELAELLAADNAPAGR